MNKRRIYKLFTRITSITTCTSHSSLCGCSTVYTALSVHANPAYLKKFLQCLSGRSKTGLSAIKPFQVKQICIFVGGGELAVLLLLLHQPNSDKKSIKTHLKDT